MSKLTPDLPCSFSPAVHGGAALLSYVSAGVKKNTACERATHEPRRERAHHRQAHVCATQQAHTQEAHTQRAHLWARTSPGANTAATINADWIDGTIAE